MSKNPYVPLVLSEDTMVTINEGDEKKMVDAKRHRVRYMVGESNDRRYVDSGGDEVDALEDKTVYVVASIHRMSGDPYHYDASSVETVSGRARLQDNTQLLNRHPACESHELIEVTYESPGVECCAMTKEEADKQQVPLQHMAGYLLGKSNGLIKLALSKMVIEESGKTYYDNIHIIPEAVVKEWNCLE
ncbi:MAG: hypothetical protein ACFE7R_02840 [Candidatus Hodarchaeota archaeon]